VHKSSDSSLQASRRSLCAHAICIRDVFFAYLCIFIIESACLFPAVWVR